MSPAVFRRFEERMTGNGWAGIAGLDCYVMPTLYEDAGLTSPPDILSWRFAWTGESLEKWVTQRDTTRLTSKGFVQVNVMVAPGGFRIGDEQAIFDIRSVLSRETVPMEYGR